MIRKTWINFVLLAVMSAWACGASADDHAADAKPGQPKPADDAGKAEHKLPDKVTMVSIATDPERAFYDLDKHRFVKPPEGLDMDDHQAVWAWMVNNGVELMADPDYDGTQGLLIPKGQGRRISDSDWDTPDTHAIERGLTNTHRIDFNIGNPKEITAGVMTVRTVSTEENPSRTWSMRKNFEQEVWLVQFIAYSDDPKGKVVFKYKRLPPESEEQKKQRAAKEAQEAEAMRVATEKEKIESVKFLKAQAAKPGAVQTESGLIYFELKAGDGDRPGPTDHVTVRYHGTLRDGSVIDESADPQATVTFHLKQVIPGWIEGLQRMKVGGKARLVIPSHLGYGDTGVPKKILGGAAMVYEVELVGIEKAPKPDHERPASIER